MTTFPAARVPSGVPAGGQFAPSARCEADVSLGAPADPVAGFEQARVAADAALAQLNAAAHAQVRALGAGLCDESGTPVHTVSADYIEDWFEMQYLDAQGRPMDVDSDTEQVEELEDTMRCASSYLGQVKFDL